MSKIGRPRLELGDTVPRDRAAEILRKVKLSEAARLLGVSRCIASRWKRELRIGYRSGSPRLRLGDAVPRAVAAETIRESTVSEAMRRLGVSRRVVQRWARELGVSPASYRKEIPFAVVQAMRSGMKASEAAKSLGLPPRTVSRWFVSLRRSA